MYRCWDNQTAPGTQYGKILAWFSMIDNLYELLEDQLVMCTAVLWQYGNELMNCMIVYQLYDR
jgi:hypothetical protein